MPTSLRTPDIFRSGRLIQFAVIYLLRSLVWTGIAASGWWNDASGFDWRCAECVA